MQVFISYSADGYDERFATVLANRLQRCGVDAFLAPRSIEPGKQWEPELRAALQRATHFVVLDSQAARKSKWVRREIEIALERNEAGGGPEIIPVWLSEKRNKILEKFQGVPFAKEDEPMLRAVAAALHVTMRSMEEEIVRKIRGSEAPERNENLLLPRLCDRLPQVRLFDLASSYFTHRRLRPQVFFIHGSEEECPESLVDRLVRTTLQTRADELASQPQAYVPQWQVEWPTIIPFQARLGLLCESLVRASQTTVPKDQKPEDSLRQALRGVTSKMLVVQHRIESSYWDRTGEKLLSRYVKLWSDVLPPETQAVLLFACIYDETPPKDARMKSFLEGALQRFEKSSATAPWVALHELPCVKRTYVETWFNLFNDDYVLRNRTRVLNDLFAARDCQPMATVESKLIEFQGELSTWDSR